jgi:hypothetical protein
VLLPRGDQGLRTRRFTATVAIQKHLASRRPTRLAPEIFEPGGCELGIPHRVLDIFVSEVILQRAGIVPGIRQRVAAGVTEVSFSACAAHSAFARRGCARQPDVRFFRLSGDQPSRANRYYPISKFAMPVWRTLIASSPPCKPTPEPHFAGRKSLM